MKRLASLFLLTPLCLSLPSCASAGRGAAEAAGGVATAAAVGVAIPLMPLAAAYNFPESYRWHKQDKEFWAQHDPEVLKQTAQLQARDPKADARRAWKNGTRAYFRGHELGFDYAGIPNGGGYDQKQLQADKRTIAASPFLSGLEKQSSGDLPPGPKLHSISPACVAYKAAGQTYRTAFNLEMQRLGKGR